MSTRRTAHIRARAGGTGTACYHPLVPRSSRAKLWLLIVLLLVLAVVAPISYLGWRQSGPRPTVTLTPPRVAGHRTAIPLVVQAARGQVARVEVRALQGGKSAVVATHEGALGRRLETAIALDAAAAGLREGSATLEVWARDDYWRPLRFDDRPLATVPITLDLTPPRIEILAATPYVAPGGAGLVVFKATDATRVETRAGTATYPTVAAGAEGARVGLFALAHDWAPGTALAVVAQDEAGNTATRGVPTELLPRRFPRDTIEVKDAFLQAKVPELLPQHPPSKPLIEGFLVINRDQRRQAEEEKRRIGARTADKPLWEGAFLQPRNTKVFANFAETRTYLYQGREVDTQVHYGYDLASTKQMPVPAANTGVVAFAGPLTIYGNTVVVDHGLGLMTLYGHLSTMDVKPGDAVARGQELGRSGATGLALGDHLHYEVLVHGVSVTPLEWWDAKWIRDRIAGPLRAAGLQVAGVAAPEPVSAERPARPPRPRRAR